MKFSPWIAYNEGDPLPEAHRLVQWQCQDETRDEVLSEDPPITMEARYLEWKFVAYYRVVVPPVTETRLIRFYENVGGWVVMERDSLGPDPATHTATFIDGKPDWTTVKEIAK